MEPNLKFRRDLPSGKSGYLPSLWSCGIRELRTKSCQIFEERRLSGKILSYTSVENHGFPVPIEQDTVVNVPADCAGKHDFFEVAALLEEVFHRIAVRDADHVLLDDGAIVEYLGNVVAGRSDQFDPALEGLVVGLGAHKRRQK